MNAYSIIQRADLSQLKVNKNKGFIYLKVLFGNSP